MTKFEKVNKYINDSTLVMPIRKTKNSAGYDMVAAEDYIIMPYDNLMGNMLFEHGVVTPDTVLSLDDMAALTKKTKAKPTLVSTGVKCQLEPNTYLELSVRSSSPLKYWLVLANGVGRL